MKKIDLKNIFVKMISNSMTLSGIDSVHRRLTAKDKITFIFYHDIAQKSPLPETKLYIEERYFFSHIKELKKRYSIISMSSILSGEPLPPYPLVISFDGFSAKYLEIAKALSKRKISALFYLQTEPIFSGRPHSLQQLYYICKNLRNVNINANVNGKLIACDLSKNAVENIGVAGKLFGGIRYGEDKRIIVDEIAREHGIDLKGFDEMFRPLTPGEVRKLSMLPGIEIGSHSHTHPNLERLDGAEVEDELKLSKELLESWSQNEVVHFCYPSGNFSQKVIELVRKIGYLTATTTVKKRHVPYASPDWPYLIPRYCVSNGPYCLLLAELVGIYSFIDQMIGIRKRINKVFHAQ